VIKEIKLRQTAKITSTTEFEPWEPNQKAGDVTTISSTGIKMNLIDT
jgi:hypothetical protein